MFNRIWLGLVKWLLIISWSLCVLDELVLLISIFHGWRLFSEIFVSLDQQVGGESQPRKVNSYIRKINKWHLIILSPNSYARQWNSSKENLCGQHFSLFFPLPRTLFSECLPLRLECLFDFFHIICPCFVIRFQCCLLKVNRGLWMCHHE